MSMVSTYAFHITTKNKNVDISDWSPGSPFNELGLLPPAIELETKSVLKACVTARTALAELKQAAALIPNPAMLINTLPILEAQASSEIENIVTTTDELFRHLSLDGATDSATKEAARYRDALFAGAALLETRPLCIHVAEVVCGRIKGTAMEVRRVPGTELRSTTTHEVIYTPPVGEELLRGLLKNWEDFLHDENLDPLVRLAVAHYQFEAIHPFIDGNGRTGRVLNSLYLMEQELIPMPILYLSRYINRTRDEYYRRLLEVTTAQAWETWIVYMLKGIEQTAVWTLDKIGAIRRLAEQTRVAVRSANPKIYSRELVDAIFEQPYCRISRLVDAGIAKRETVSRYLKVLADLGILREEKSGRAKLFINTKLLDLLSTDSSPQ